MQITSVKQGKYECGIPLKGLDSVKAALQVFSRGGSIALSENVSQMEGMAAVLLLTYLSGGGDEFLERLFPELESIVRGRGCFSHSYDYDGPGPFHKATVEVFSHGEDDTFILGLHAAYVGREIEARLAQKLGVERGLQWLCVDVETAPIGNRFQFDFDEVAARLKSLPEFPQDLTGESMVAVITSYGNDDSSKRFSLQPEKELVVSVFLDDVTQPFEYGVGEKKLVWIADGAKLSGPLQKSYTDRGKFRSPKVAISIFGNRKGKFGATLPIIDPAVKARAQALADRVEAAFRL